jgi:methylthioribose-1-phosphate isomerase
MRPVQRPLRPLFWDGDTVIILDQRLLPRQEKTIRCTTANQVLQAIRTMAIRGAPAVGLAGAMALALGAEQLPAADPQTFRRKFVRLCQQVRAARPTGRNLGWAVERIYQVVAENPEADVFTLRTLVRQCADRLVEEDLRVNRLIGSVGAAIVPRGAAVLTYCNTGYLATGGYGTALGIIRSACAADPSIQIYVCETRPFLQGARLTAYELLHESIPATLIADNAAGALLYQKKVDLVLVGADCIAANGDVANKIGTYTLAALAHLHQVPFYVAAPRSTIDAHLPDGQAIPIEERDPRELTHFRGHPVAAEGVAVWNPAFDITPHRYLTGIVTEVGILTKPFRGAVQKALKAGVPF